MKHAVLLVNYKRTLRRLKTLRSVAFVVIVVCLVLGFSISATQEAHAYKPDENHAPLVIKAYEGFQLVDWNVTYPNSGGRTVAEAIEDGVIAEDMDGDVCYGCIPGCGSNSHFWDPENGGPWDPAVVINAFPLLCSLDSDCVKNSLYKATFLTAKALQQDRQGNYTKAYEYLGHIAHLLQDQSVPAHVHEHFHSGIVTLSDLYESYMETRNGQYSWYDTNGHPGKGVSTPVGLIDIPPDVCQQFFSDPDWKEMWEKNQEWKDLLSQSSWSANPPCPTCVSMEYDDNGNVIDPCSNTYGVGLAKIAYLMYTTNQYADWWESCTWIGCISGDKNVKYFDAWIDYSELQESGISDQLDPLILQGFYNYRYALRATATLYQVYQDMVKPTLTVNSLADPGVGICDQNECTLREAITMAAPMATIRFDDHLSGGEIVLKDTLTFTKNLTIDASPLPANIAINGDSSKRVIFVQGGHVILKGVDILNGVAESGGGIYNLGGVALSDCAIHGNQASSSDGGGIYNGGWLTAVNCTFTGNVSVAGNGGAIASNTSYKTHIFNSTFSNNRASFGDGGGLSNTNGELIIANSLFTNNAARNGGGVGIG
ncbi:MAG: CSLREA domain-containing protein, partial [Anaerolineaceae bacterium]|nr:CSLREA domain-containing protein [Anaerolineaceae bacterium]